MPYERTYTNDDLKNDIFLSASARTQVEKALNSGKQVKIIHSSFEDKGSDYSEIRIEGKVIHHQNGY